MTHDKALAKMLGDAIIIATNAHAGQFDKGGQPYILHPMHVSCHVNGDDIELKCAAFLHDTVEDCNITVEDLRTAGMSERVIACVKALTKLRGQTYEEYQAGVFANRDAMIVKSADLRHNSDIRRLKSVTEKDVARIAKYMMFYSQLQAKLLEV